MSVYLPKAVVRRMPCTSQFDPQRTFAPTKLLPFCVSAMSVPGLSRRRDDGDRADAILAAPEEIDGFIKHEC
jgi:hypothetical protein